MKKWHVTTKKIEKESTIDTTTTHKFPKRFRQHQTTKTLQQDTQALEFRENEAPLFSIEFKREKTVEETNISKLHLFSHMKEKKSRKWVVNVPFLTIQAANEDIYNQLKTFAHKANFGNLANIENKSEFNFTIHPAKDRSLVFVAQLQQFLPFSDKARACLLDFFFDNVVSESSENFFAKVQPEVKPKPNSLWVQESIVSETKSVYQIEANQNNMRSLP